ncbi:MAG: creatininase family protein, partial [Candidatus Binatia bacterium]
LYVLAETTWKTVKETPYEVAVLPWGAIEAHNYHLPYATDVVLSDHVAAESARLAWARGAKVVVLPTVPFGVNTGQMDIALTINMNPSTQASVLADVVASLAGQRVPKLVVCNGHGGNEFRQMLRELQPRFPGIFLCCLNWYQVVDTAGYFRPGDHAGEMETSLLLHCAPHLVGTLSGAGPGAARQFTIRALREKWAWAPRAWTRVTEDTGVGDPRHATAEKGAAYFADVTGRIADFLVELAACRLDELYE